MWLIYLTFNFLYYCVFLNNLICICDYIKLSSTFIFSSPKAGKHISNWEHNHAYLQLTDIATVSLKIRPTNAQNEFKY